MLAGVPVTIKVNIDQKYATTNGARVNQHNIAEDYYSKKLYQCRCNYYRKNKRTQLFPMVYK